MILTPAQLKEVLESIKDADSVSPSEIVTIYKITSTDEKGETEEDICWVGPDGDGSFYDIVNENELFYRECPVEIRIEKEDFLLDISLVSVREN